MSCPQHSQNIHKFMEQINFLKYTFFLSSELTFGTTKSHDQRAVALVELPEAGTASSVSDDGQLSQDESLLTQKKTTVRS